MKTRLTRGTKEVLLLVLTLVLVAIFTNLLVTAVPQGATAQGAVVVDGGPNNTAASRTDPGGEIITINLDLAQQNRRWKAYVGNVTGKFVLQNINNQSIYEWTLPTVDGEVYITRNSSLTFASMGCAQGPVIAAADVALGLNSSTVYSINGTFNSTTHEAFTVSGTSISGCPSTALWVNDTVQLQTATSLWPEVLLNDSGQNLIYAALMNPDKSGYSNATYDFQAIVAENDSSVTGSTYYFFIELG